MRLLLALAILLLLPAGLAAAQTVPYSQEAEVCPVEPGDTGPPDFERPNCVTIPLRAVDPQGGAMWVRLIARTEPGETGGVPLGLFISGKASSEAWIDGVRIGANGQPARLAADERPGRMDAVIAIPPGLVTGDETEIVLMLSAHQGFLRLDHPLHALAIAPYADPTRFILSAYWPALVTLGVFVIGFAVFSVTALRGEDRTGSALLAVLSFSAAAQLLTETARGFIAYPYPWHDVRLIALVALASLFGLALVTLATLKAARLAPGARWGVIGATAFAILLTAQYGMGFDQKTALAVFVPALAGCGVATWGIKQGVKQAVFWLAALAAFAIAFLISGGLFLDRYFYMVMAGFLTALFVLQAISLGHERRERLVLESRSRKLEAALDLARERAAPSDIAITAPGRMEKLSTARITHLKGAGDYVEIQMEDGRTVLHGGTLAALEETLPATFLRVHRSFIVNTAFVKALEREASGTGLLTLTTGAVIPVSRRVLPAVRAALSGSG